MSQKIDVQWCPVCFHKLELTSQVLRIGDPRPKQEAKASPGDYTVCIECATMLQFGKNMKLEIVPDDVPIDPRSSAMIRVVQRQIKSFAKEKPFNVWKM